VVLIPDQLEAIARSPGLDRIHEYGLVVLSQRAPYWVREEDGEYLLLVEAGRAGELSRQLGFYDRESVNWPPPEPALAESETPPWAALGWILILFFGHGLSQQWPELYAFGRSSAEQVMHGEVYRAFTALLLHSDFGHLTGNLVFGAIFVHLVSRFIGAWWALPLVLLSGFLGNLLNAALYYPADHYSIGASTAVFGAIGILVAIPGGFALRHRAIRILRLWTIPMVVGLVFLAWFGTGDAQTDTSAHLLGFASGLGVGFLAGLTVREFG